MTEFIWALFGAAICLVVAAIPTFYAVPKQVGRAAFWIGIFIAIVLAAFAFWIRPGTGSDTSITGNCNAIGNSNSNCSVQ
ncbi:hypothetical protein [Lichenihabitans psoromatis]|uniref:hypothetical protein n=1 Tax=Lichenihabitans psoromatis TaxID=2528642 RepID=UPI0010383CFA|nr:hypothetical protein [Lichenihabitans psoromatis]